MASAIATTTPDAGLAAAEGRRTRSVPRRRSGLVALRQSPLARKIVAFNLVGLALLVAGVLWIDPHRHSLVVQRGTGLVTEARLIAQVFEAADARPDDAVAAQEVLARFDLPQKVEVFVFDPRARLIGSTLVLDPAAAPPAPSGRGARIRDALGRALAALGGWRDGGASQAISGDLTEQARALVPEALAGVSRVVTGRDADGGTVFTVAVPIGAADAARGIVAVTSAAGEIDRLARADREQILQLFLVAVVVSTGLSLALASAIANPLSELAAAAEVGREPSSRNVSSRRVRIPDLTARRDEIGRLSGAVRGMVGALYDRIDANEQFAADVAHEIKNPLASLGSAVGALRHARRDDQRATLLDVIEHDVRRLDRLVSDISNASRLDSELVREEEEPFDLAAMLAELCEHMGATAAGRGIELVSDLPAHPVVLRGLDPRLAQVFVNLLSNAISFCDEGDAIRIWARRRNNRVLVVVEDTGPGIPETALERIFNRFYSERPETQFGNNSGLGLAISKQIVEAHGGVIWAENIRPTEADPTSEPAGARIVVGLPV